MLEYLPWSISTSEHAIGLYNEGIFSILDFELGGCCNLNCLYCDSPERAIKINFDINLIQKLLSEKKFKWLFVCGIGEPTAGDNYDAFIKLLESCEKYGVKCSAFSNIFLFNDDIVHFINNDILYLKFKLDSFETNNIKYLYGTEKSNIILKNIERITDVVKSNSLHTNIAASIVPTKVNYNEIEELFSFCLQSNIYPLIGHLEYSGRAIEMHRKLALSVDEHESMYRMIREKFGIDYSLPVCPAVVSGVRIDSDGYIILDKDTGLTCDWLWLRTPSTKKIGHINQYVSSIDIFNDILDYRKEKIGTVKSLLENNNLPTGGCGGNAKDVLSYYIRNSGYY
ncbi:MAG: hypothetical protein WC799_24815 [Desulfobacteraceae bacterium]|jgi:MoaA/NifB/PqqE/SkfB family radical SAM enzyme